MTSNTTSHPIGLTIAGSDCSGGAGIQADLKTFLQFGVHGLSAITSIVSETPHIVHHIEPVAMPLIQDQINLLLDTYPVGAIKTGLLPTRATSIGVFEILKQKNIPLVVDPVMVASSGTILTDTSTLNVIIDRLLPITTIVTPNLDEASAILNRPIESPDDMESAAREISEKHQTSCLIKGGHLPGKGDRIDILWHNEKSTTFSHHLANLPTTGIHGTGCTLSAAITAGLALGNPLELAVKNAIDFVQKLISDAHSWSSISGNSTIHCLGW